MAGMAALCIGLIQLAIIGALLDPAFAPSWPTANYTNPTALRPVSGRQLTRVHRRPALRTEAKAA